MNIPDVTGYWIARYVSGWLIPVMTVAVLVMPVSRAEEASEYPVYKPPCRGAPVTRTGGGTRGIRENLPSIQVLAPEHTGHTAQAQPGLFWYVPKPVPESLEFSLMAETDDEPLLEVRLENPGDAGVQRIALADYDFSLEKGVPYRFTVITQGTEPPAGVLFSSGMIRRVELPADIGQALQDTVGEDRVALYASAGLWYDALDSVSALIETEPENRRLHQVRRSLLRQVGLNNVSLRLQESTSESR
jgi:hypothetical protein